MIADICLELRQFHVEVVARTNLVTVPVMMELIDAIAGAVRNKARSRVLLEVIAPKCLITLFDRVEIWAYAVRSGLQGVRIAHVITGRPVKDEDAETFKEDYAHNRGILVSTFTDRAHALAWLNGTRVLALQH